MISPALRRSIFAAVLILILGAGRKAPANVGDPDAGFGDAGYARILIGDHPGSASAAALSPDGKTVIAGSYGPMGNRNWFVARLQPDGRLDPGFGTGGIATWNFGRDDVATAVALTPGLKVVVGGYSQEGERSFGVLAMLCPNGQPDDGFNCGRGFGRLGSRELEWGNNAALQGLMIEEVVYSSGRNFEILAAGNRDGNLVFQEYYWNGNPRFGNPLTADFDGEDRGRAVAIVDGKFLVAGTCAREGGAPDFCLAAFHRWGPLDNRFGTGGRVRTDVSNRGSNDFAHVLTGLPDGKFLVGGESNQDFAVLRYFPDGRLDTSFGNWGKVLLNVGTDRLAGLHVLPDGKILLTGSAQTPEGTRAILARLLPDGRTDPDFAGPSGFLAFDRMSPNGAAADGRSVVIAGQTDRPDVSVARHRLIDHRVDLGVEEIRDQNLTPGVASGPVAFNVFLANNSPEAATAASLDVFADNLTVTAAYLERTRTPCPFERASVRTTIRCALGDIPAGDKPSVTVEARPTAPQSVLTARISSRDVEINRTDNTASLRRVNWIPAEITTPATEGVQIHALPPSSPPWVETLGTPLPGGFRNLEDQGDPSQDAKKDAPFEDQKIDARDAAPLDDSDVKKAPEESDTKADTKP